MSFDFDNGVLRILSASGFTTTIVPSETANTVLTSPVTPGEFVTDNSKVELTNKNLISATNEVAANWLRVNGENYLITGGNPSSGDLLAVKAGREIGFIQRDDNALKYAGEWTVGKYSKNDLVQLAGSLYIATADTSANPPSTPWIHLRTVGAGADGSIPVYGGNKISGSRLTTSGGNLTVPGDLSVGAITANDSLQISVGGVLSLLVSGGHLQLPAGKSNKPPNGSIRYNPDTKLVETYSAEAWISQGGIINKSVSEIIITSTTPSDLINYVVPGGLMTDGSILRIKTSGYWTNNGGNNTAQVNFAITFGNATLWSDESGRLKRGDSVGWAAELIICNRSNMSQSLTGEIKICGEDSNDNGRGDLGNNEINSHAVINGTSSVNTAQSQRFKFVLTQDSSNMNFTKLYHTVELL